MIKQIIDKIKLAAFAIPVHADETINITAEDLGGDAKYGRITQITTGSLIAGLIYAIFVITAIVFFFLLIMGGIKWLTSGGDEKKVAAARTSITSALVGLTIVFASWAIMTLLGKLLGFDLFNLVIPSLV